MVENEEECTYMYVMPVQKVKKKKNSTIQSFELQPDQVSTLKYELVH